MSWHNTHVSFIEKLWAKSRQDGDLETLSIATAQLPEQLNSKCKAFQPGVTENLLAEISKCVYDYVAVNISFVGNKWENRDKLYILVPAEKKASTYTL